ncbi:unnamed protein product [Citrullus colocynthis]|uniref:Uncharacterized protein n=1 Tax=Citrullus colocynthis TaxID=252529 RepID=A0ABP0XT34_9ROSI
MRVRTETCSRHGAGATTALLFFFWVLLILPPASLCLHLPLPPPPPPSRKLARFSAASFRHAPPATELLDRRQSAADAAAYGDDKRLIHTGFKTETPLNNTINAHAFFASAKPHQITQCNPGLWLENYLKIAACQISRPFIFHVYVLHTTCITHSIITPHT